MIRGHVFDAFDDAEIERLLRPLRPPLDEQASDLDDVFAAALWSSLVEPGDAAGGLLRATLGAARALEALSWPDSSLLARLAEVGVADADRLDLTAARARWAPRIGEARFRAAVRSARVLGVRLVVPGDVEWPRGFDDLGIYAPAALWVRGDLSAPSRGPSVAIVGSRACSGYGEQVAAELSSAMAERGVTVYSGGAYGIDGMAHRAALASAGTTVAVMAGGVDRLYPAGHHELLARVVERGAVVSEVPCGTAPSRWRFLQRNRLIAAAAAATVVVEAGSRSGALNTVGHARSLERPVGAVPGPITSPASEGCHRLLREPDIACISRAADVFELLEPSLVELPVREGAARAAPEVLRVLDALSGRRARDEHEIARSSGLGEAVVRSTLAVLELDGRARESARGWLRV